MFYWVKLHHWKCGNKELQHEDYDLLSRMIKRHIDAGWTVTCMKVMNRNEREIYG